MHSNVVQHGVFLDIFDKGVLLMGPSGCGKSDCALQLLARGHRLIADDAPTFYRTQTNQIIGFCPERIQNALEIRALGIIDVRQLFGENAVLSEKNLDLIVHLAKLNPCDVTTRKLQIELHHQTILDVPIPTLSIPLVLGQNLAILIECAVRLAFAPKSPTLLRLTMPTELQICD